MPSRVSIKGYALADFIVECTGMTNNPKEPVPKLDIWKVYIDGASNEKGVGAEALPTGKGRVKHVIVVVDYFTKWVEVEPMNTITSKKALDFIVKHIGCSGAMAMGDGGVVASRVGSVVV
uniref:Integrase catalytic domain-containing protein n=1 Tax=Cannabis sativa TaxID=3483 RepID=A0A803NHA7_CANSA